MNKILFQILEREGQMRLFNEQGIPASIQEARRVIGELMNAYPSPGCVYVAEKIEAGLSIYKIGMTGQEPTKRLHQIRFDEGDPTINLIHTINCADIAEARALERWLHEFFTIQHVRGEWFELADEDISWLLSHNKAPMDVDSISMPVDRPNLGKEPYVYIPKRYYAEIRDSAGNRFGVFRKDERIAQAVRLMASPDREFFLAMVRLERLNKGERIEGYGRVEAERDLDTIRKCIEALKNLIAQHDKMPRVSRP